MGFSRTGSVIVLAGVSLLVFCIGAAGAPAVGSTIEVREGDSWSKVKVVAIEGHRLQVQYDDGTQEWVGPDRLRPGTAAPTPAGGGAGAASPDSPSPTGSGKGGSARAVHAFAVGQDVEYKTFNKWVPARVEEIDPHGWICILSSEERPKRIWIEGWSVRLAGSAYDFEQWGGGAKDAPPGSLPPNERVHPAPRSSGDPFVVVPVEARPPTLDQLTSTFEVIPTDTAAEPAAGGELPAPMPVAPASTEYVIWGVRGDDRISDVLTGPGSSKIAVAAIQGNLGKHSQIVRCSVPGHQQMDTRPLPMGDLKVMSFASEGDVVLTAVNFNRQLQLWQWNGKDGYKLSANFQIGKDGGSIRDAKLLGPDKLVVHREDGLVGLIDLAKKQLVSAIRSAPGAKLFVHPSGQLVGVITSSGTAAVLRASDFAVVAEFTDAGNTGNLAIDPSGQVAAYVGASGAVEVKNIKQNQPLGTIAVGSAFTGQLVLVDDKFLVVDRTTVYEIKRGIPVWIYRIPADAAIAQTANGQFLAGINRNGRTGMALFTIPDSVGRSALKTFDPSRFILQPGMAIKVDADYNAFGKDSAAAAQTVEQILTAAGMKLSKEDQPFHLSLAIAAGPSENRNYVSGNGFGFFNRKVTAVQAPSSVLTATLNYHNTAVWSQTIKFQAGGMLEQDSTHSFQDNANAAARPNAAALKSLAFPSFLPDNAKPGTPPALGASEMQDRRFVPDTASAVTAKFPNRVGGSPSGQPLERSR